MSTHGQLLQLLQDTYLYKEKLPGDCSRGQQQRWGKAIRKVVQHSYCHHVKNSCYPRVCGLVKRLRSPMHTRLQKLRRNDANDTDHSARQTVEES